MTQRVVSFHYVLFNKHRAQVDSSVGKQPFPVLEGAKQIIPGLEEELFKLQVGEKTKVEIPSEKAYGPVNESLVLTIKRDKLPEGDVQVGTQFSVNNDNKGPVFTVTKIEGEDVHVDGNHPLAGEDLTFEIEVVEIRESTEEERKHSHAHGPEGHSH